MNTKDFKTKTVFLERENAQVPDAWVIGLDIGYSSTKIFSPNIVASFPSYARMERITGTIGNLPKEYIRYRDLETGDTWIVGENAQDSISLRDTTDSEQEIYGRERYSSPMFRVIAGTGLAIAFTKNRFGNPDGKPIYVQTGLPARYMSKNGGDASELKDAIAGEYHFSLKLGNTPEVEYHFKIDRDHVYVMIQPIGTMFSVATSKSGSFLSNVNDYFSRNVIVFDPGFGTLDICPIKQYTPQDSQTFPDLGMKQVFLNTSARIRETYGTNIPIYAMQRYLEDGKFLFVDKKKHASKYIPFDDILDEECRKVCVAALERMERIYPIDEYSYLIVTGGCGAAWNAVIRDYYKDMESLKVVDGNVNDDLPFIFANVRGYYHYRRQKISKEMRDRQER